MGNGFDFTKKQAESYLRSQLQKLNITNNNINQSPCQVGKMNSDRTQAEMPDGSIVDVQVEGIPDDYMIICNGIAYKSDVPFTAINQTGVDGYIAGYTGSQYYIRKLGSNIKYIIDTGKLGFDSRMDLSKLQLKFSQDGKCFLIGGFYQDYPPKDLWEDQISQGSGGCQGNCYAIPGYTYHTFASWAVFAGFSFGFDTDNPTNPIVVSEDLLIETNFDLTQECLGKITPPTQEGLGSAAIYRLFPTASNITPFSDNSSIDNGGNLIENTSFGVDVNGNPPDARFYPAVNESYTWQGYPFTIHERNAPDLNYSGISGTGELITAWASNGDAFPLFLNFNHNAPVAITEANMQYVFSVDSTGLSYTVDIISDISFATTYRVDSVSFTAQGVYGFVVPSEGIGGNGRGAYANCSYTTLMATNFSYSIDQPLYPYLSQFYNSFADQYIVPGSIQQHAPSDSRLFTDITYVNSGFSSFSIANPPTTYNYDIDSAMTLKICDHPPIGGGPFTKPYCSIFRLRQIEDPVGGFGAGPCKGGGLSESCNICAYVSTTTHSVVNWDGSSATVIDDFIFQGLHEFFNTFYAPTNCCNNNPLCCEVSFGSAIYDPTYNQMANISGFFTAYRFGRGSVSFEKVQTILNGGQKVGGSGDSWFSFDTDYKGPAITLERLSSHSNQNHMYAGYRGLNGNTALVYFDVDPYVPQFGPDLSFRPFSGYFFSAPYISTSIAVNQTNPVVQGPSPNPPDAFTDAVLSGPGLWPFPNDLAVKGLDSFILEGYSRESNTDGQGNTTVTEIITLYGVQNDGETNVNSTLSGIFAVTGEQSLLDFIYPVDPTKVTV